jgi:hypothetical protein
MQVRDGCQFRATSLAFSVNALDARRIPDLSAPLLGASMRPSLIAVAVMSLLALTTISCATSNYASVSLIPEESFNQKQTGMIVLSTGAPESCITSSTYLTLINLGTEEEIKNIPVDYYSIESEFDDHIGFLSALALPPGKYALRPFIANPYIFAHHPRFEFEVVAGKAIYLGEFFMLRSCSLSNRFVFRDNYDRDMKRAIKLNPGFANKAIEKRIISRWTN